VDTATDRAGDDVVVVHLDLATLQALAGGDLAAANATAPVPLSPYAAGPAWRGVWQRRVHQVAADPEAAAWVTGIVWDAGRSLAVGRAGFHAPPDADGLVEVGYAVDPAQRRRGYGGAALRHLLARAAADPRVTRVRASVRPDNEPSLRIVRRHGFTEVGEQWDDEDGLETVFEVAARPTS